MRLLHSKLIFKEGLLIFELKEAFPVIIFQYLEEKHEYVLRCWEMELVLDRWNNKRLDGIVVYRLM